MFLKFTLFFHGLLQIVNFPYLLHEHQNILRDWCQYGYGYTCLYTNNCVSTLCTFFFPNVEHFWRDKDMLSIHITVLPHFSQLILFINTIYSMYVKLLQLLLTT